MNKQQFEVIEETFTQGIRIFYQSNEVIDLDLTKEVIFTEVGDHTFSLEREELDANLFEYLEGIVL